MGWVFFLVSDIYFVVFVVGIFLILRGSVDGRFLYDN